MELKKSFIPVFKMLKKQTLQHESCTQKPSFEWSRIKILPTHAKIKTTRAPRRGRELTDEISAEKYVRCSRKQK